MGHHSPHVQKLVQIEDDVRERFERLSLDQINSHTDFSFRGRTSHRNPIGQIHLRVRIGRFAPDALCKRFRF